MRDSSEPPEPPLPARFPRGAEDDELFETMLDRAIEEAFIPIIAEFKRQKEEADP